MRPRSKRLYRHAAPVMVLSLAVLALSVATYGQYSSLTVDGGQVTKALIKPFLHVKPASNGLAHVSTSSNDAKKVETTFVGDQFNEAGQHVSRALLFQGNFDTTLVR